MGKSKGKKEGKNQRMSYLDINPIKHFPLSVNQQRYVKEIKEAKNQRMGDPDINLIKQYQIKQLGRKSPVSTVTLYG